jgi:hypothetical protein
MLDEGGSSGRGSRAGAAAEQRDSTDGGSMILRVNLTTAFALGTDVDIIMHRVQLTGLGARPPTQASMDRESIQMTDNFFGGGAAPDTAQATAVAAAAATAGSCTGPRVTQPGSAVSAASAGVFYLPKAAKHTARHGLTRASE